MAPANLQGEETLYTWEIENFSMCPQIYGECIKSTPFYVDSLDTSEYQLILYPRGRCYEDYEIPYCLLQCLQDGGCLIKVTMNITLEEYKVEMIKEGILLRAGETIAFPIDLGIKPGKFKLLPGDLFTIRCTVTSTYKDPQASEEDLKKLSADLEELLNRELFADFCPTAKEEKRFLVHKMMLAVRCPKLIEVAGFFDGQKKTLIDRTHPEALKVLLHYIYTGKLEEDLPPEMLEEVRTLAKELEMRDLQRDLLQMEISTVGRTIIQVNNIEWDWKLGSFYSRTQLNDWPLQNILNLPVGGFVLSCSIEANKTVIRVDLQCEFLYLDKAVTMKCAIKALGEPLCSGEHRFEAWNLQQPFVLRGNALILCRQFVTDPGLEFNFRISQISNSEECKKEEVKYALRTPFESGKRSLHRLSADMDRVFQGCLGGGEGLNTDLIVKRHVLDTPIRVHRCVLASRSGFFKDILTQDPTLQEVRIEPTLGAEGAKMLLRYLYSGKISDESNLEMVTDLYRCASRYQIKHMRDRCLHLLHTKGGLKELTVILESSSDDEASDRSWVAASMRDEV